MKYYEVQDRFLDLVQKEVDFEISEIDRRIARLTILGECLLADVIKLQPRNTSMS